MRGALMKIGIRTTLTDSQVFQVTSRIVGLVVLCAVTPIQLLSMHQTYSLLTCTRIPCKGSHCENGRVRCCIYKIKVTSWVRPFCRDVIFMIPARNSCHSDILTESSASTIQAYFVLCFSNTAAGFPAALTHWSVTRHCCWHRIFLTFYERFS